MLRVGAILYALSSHIITIRIWASSRENLSSRFPTKRVWNLSPQLLRLAKKWNFTRIKLTYDTFHKTNNKDADQSARMRRLVCACVGRKPPKTGFLTLRPILAIAYSAIALPDQPERYPELVLSCIVHTSSNVRFLVSLNKMMELLSSFVTDCYHSISPSAKLIYDIKISWSMLCPF